MTTLEAPSVDITPYRMQRLSQMVEDIAAHPGRLRKEFAIRYGLGER